VTIGQADHPTARRAPANRRVVVGAAVVDILALAIIAVAWWKASAAVRMADELPWLAVAIAAVGVAGAGHGAVLLQLRAAIARQRRRLEAGRWTGHPAGVAETAPRHPAARDGVPPTLVAAPAMRRYHRSDCRLAAGKTVRTASAEEHQRAGRTACAVCRPPGPADTDGPPSHAAAESAIIISSAGAPEFEGQGSR
jgi:hypothetical protein